MIAEIASGQGGILIVAWVVIGGGAGWAIGNSKGRGTDGLWLGLLLGILGWIVVAALPSRLAPPPTVGQWAPDPFGRYEMRYWNGAAWTANVSTGGQNYVDEPVVR